MNLTKPRLIQEHEALRNEFTICRRKLDSKCEALLILTKDLDVCRQERDQFKLMAEQVQARYQGLKRQLAGVGPRQPSFDGAEFSGMKQQNLAHLLCEMREVNKAQQFDVDDLKQKLTDARGDIKLLREQIARHRVGTTDEGINTRHFPAHEREDLVKQLEEAREQYVQMERDLQQVLDEKEELVTERDMYKTKYDRLNSELNLILKGDETRIVDIDALSMENKYLQERVKQMEEEKTIFQATVAKYKNILERKKNKGIIRLGQSRAGGVVVSQKQVQQLLENKSVLTPTPKMMADLQSLATALLETLNDKNTALVHQRKTNKILGTRVSELEKKLRTLEVSGLWNIPGKANGLEKLKLDVQEIQTLLPMSPPLGSPGESLKSDILASQTAIVKQANTGLSSDPQVLGLKLSLHDLDFLPTKEGATATDAGSMDAAPHLALLSPTDLLRSPEMEDCTEAQFHGKDSTPTAEMTTPSMNTPDESHPTSGDESTEDDYHTEELSILLGSAVAKVIMHSTESGLGMADDKESGQHLRTAEALGGEKQLLNGLHGEVKSVNWDEPLADDCAENNVNICDDELASSDRTPNSRNNFELGLSGSEQELHIGSKVIQVEAASAEKVPNLIQGECSGEDAVIESEEPSSISTSPRCTSPLLDDPPADL